MSKQKVSIANNVLTVEYPTIGKTLRVDLTKYPEGVQEDARLHGFKQKFGDAESGKSPQEKYAMVQRIHESLLDGEWVLTANRDNSDVIVEAVCRLLKLKIEKDGEGFVLVDSKAKTKKPIPAEKIKEWGAHVKVKAEILLIRSERATKLADESQDELNINLT